MLARRLPFAAAFVLALASQGASIAHADEPNPAALAQAREQFRKGIALEAAGDWEGALRIFKGVAQVKSTPQVRFHIAQAEEKTGDLVAALGSYRLASYEASEAKIKDVKAASEAAIRAIEPRIAKLTLQRGDGAAVAKVTLDGRELGPASVGAAILLNPGAHHIEASAPGRETITTDVNLAAAETKELSLVLPPAKPGSAPAAEATPERVPGDLPPTPTGTSNVKIAGFVIGGAGIVSLGVSGVFFLIRQGAISDLDKGCGADKQHCPTNLQSTFDKGQMASTVSTATLIGGAAAVAIGGIMIIAAPKKKPAASVGVAFGAPGAETGLSLTSRF